MQAAKRRRVALNPRGAYVVDNDQAYTRQHGNNAPYLRNISPYGDRAAVDPAGPSVYSLDASSFAASGQNTPPGALAPTSNSGQHWDAPPYSGVHPDTALAQPQQPYFAGYARQPTDPSTYNSPWPPQSQPQTESFGNRGRNYGASTSNTMPYLGTSNAGVLNVDASLEGAVATSLRGYGQDVEMDADYEYGLPDGQSQPVVVFPDEPSPMVSNEASMQLKNQSLPILDNLATQLIHSIAKASLPQIQEILTGGESEEEQAYNTLKSLFEQTRKVYSRESPFIDALAIQMFQPNQQEVIRKANIATFISSILGAHDVSFFHLNEFFLETFVPLGHRLLKWQGAIYLDLKTQAYISALINSDGSPSAMLDELFPADLDAQTLARHPDAPSLSPSEQDFIDRCRARKSYLRAEGNASAALRELPKKYQWTEFVREFAGCVSKNVEGIVNASIRTQNPGILDRRNTLTDDTPAQSLATTTLQNPPVSSTATASTTQTAATTMRQPWSKAEEDALLSGLERVSGPHWSQILALYGRGGSVSEMLKDRNQVQLKDKARNLKLWYLKMGREVPGSLRGVTGELRKRGGKGARAAAMEEAGEDEGEEEVDGGEGLWRASGTRTGRGKTRKGS